MSIRLLSYPATPMLLLIALYTSFRPGAEGRVHTFALLAMSAIGATELVLGVVAAFRKDRLRPLRVASHGLSALGGLGLGYALLDGFNTAVFVAGALLLGSGLIMLTFMIRNEQALED